MNKKRIRALRHRYKVIQLDEVSLLVRPTRTGMTIINIKETT